MTHSVHSPWPATDQLRWSAITPSDIDQWHALIKRMAVTDKPDWIEPREDLEQALASSKNDPGLDTVLGFDNNAIARAYGQISKNPGSALVHGSGGVDPEWRRRGIGAAVFHWQEGRTRARLAADTLNSGVLRTHAEERNAAQIALLETLGGTVVRYFTEMTRPLTKEIPDVALADGMEFMRFNDRISEAVRQAHNDAFRDHWGSEPRDKESWHFTVTHPDFKPEWSVAVVETATGDVAAYQMASFDPESSQRHGFTEAYTELLGVRRQFRGLKLAPALLTESMRVFRVAGVDNAGLGVDTENPSGALGLYENLGYAATHKSLVFDRTLTL